MNPPPQPRDPPRADPRCASTRPARCSGTTVRYRSPRAEHDGERGPARSTNQPTLEIDTNPDADYGSWPRCWPRPRTRRCRRSVSSRTSSCFHSAARLQPAADAYRQTLADFSAAHRAAFFYRLRGRRRQGVAWDRAYHQKEVRHGVLPALPLHPRSIAEMNITPLVDVMLVLLVIFMVAAPVLTETVDCRLCRSGAADIRKRSSR